MVRRFDVSALPATPWKNGGGSTLEVARWPAAAGIEDFDWRVSIATIAASGPFSVFPGVDRSITLLEGDGVQLQGEGVAHRLAAPLEPFAFAGDGAVDCRLLGGASRDFNVMSRRGRWRPQVRVLRGAGELPVAPHGLLLAWRGDWSATSTKGGGDQVLRAGQGLWWADADCAWSMACGEAEGALLAVQWHPAAAGDAPAR